MTPSPGGDKAYDGPFYRERSLLERIDSVKVPTFIVGGWFDFFQRSEPELYRRLRANGVPTRLMGPGTTSRQVPGGLRQAGSMQASLWPLTN